VIKIYPIIRSLRTLLMGFSAISVCDDSPCHAQTQFAEIYPLF